MGKKLVISAATIGTFLVLMGFYLFPFGQDLFLSALTNLGGGSYATGVLYAYIITGSMLLVGLHLTNHRLIYAFGGRIASTFFIVLFMALGYVLFSVVTHTWG
jgi:hypothetical protein